MRGDYKGARAAAVPKVQKSLIAALISGVLIAYAITCIMFIGCALALTYTSLSENAIPTIMLITVAVSVLVAGFDAAKSAERRGWLWGMLAGIAYATILICIETWVAGVFMIDQKTIASTILAVACGGFGGVIGINFNKK